MTETQQLLMDLSVVVKDNMITEDMCIGLADALNGVPEEYHFKAFKALIKGGADRA